MSKIFCQGIETRLPVPVNEIQVNFCRNPLCPNFGIPASIQKQAKGRGKKVKDSYTIFGSTNKSTFNLKCLYCGRKIAVKSNLAIIEELARIAHYLNKPASYQYCPNQDCSNYSPIGTKGAYFVHGKTKSGSKRYKCLECGKTFSIGKSLKSQRKTHINKIVFKLLVNRTPFKRICSIVDINISTLLYDKLNFIHKQCLAYISNRECFLKDHVKFDRLYLATDRQEYFVNWTSRFDRKNVLLYNISTADLESGYIFGNHVNFDPDMDINSINEISFKTEDYKKKKPFRRFARLWTYTDYKETIGVPTNNRYYDGNNLSQIIRNAYIEAFKRDDYEFFNELTNEIDLPKEGMLVHAEYTMYAHFLFLKKILPRVEKLRLFMDLDTGFRSASLAIFQKEIENRTCDLFLVKSIKGLSVDEKRGIYGNFRRRVKRVQKQNSDLSDFDVYRMFMKEQFKNPITVKPWDDVWYIHPVPNMSEPEKAICHLTDYDDYDEDHRANLYLKGSLHAVDRYFMQIRRKISMLERPIVSASNIKKRWYGYSAYKPSNVIKMLDIFRVYYNFCQVGDDKKTPAQRLGLAKGPVDLEKILYF